MRASGFALASLLALLGAAHSLLAAEVSNAPLPEEKLSQLDQTELGSLYKAQDKPRYAALHPLLEKYFAADAALERTRIVGMIDKLGLDRAVVGRLARIRRDWQPLAPGVYYINEKIGPHEVRYFLGIPKRYDLTKSWPLVEKLPVTDAFLTKPPPDADKVVQIYTQWMKDELTAHPDAVVVMPLLNLDELWGPGPVGMSLAIQPVLDAANRANIDPTRVDLIGHSMSASAAWNLAIFYPTYFAAINPLAGALPNSWQRYRLGNLRNIFSVVWADSEDLFISVRQSQEIVRYLRNIHYNVDYLETTGVGHLPSPAIVEQEYQKLRAYQRELYPPNVFIQSNSPDTIFNRADWVQIYQPISTGQQGKLQISRGSQGMYLYQIGFRVDAQIRDRHTITLQTQNVELLRLYLNDQLVDLSQPLTVIVNKKERFHGLVPQSTDEMLKDQVFLGRGWRCYTAILDLNLEPKPAPPTTQPRAPIEYTTPSGEHKVFIPHGDGDNP